jgi:Sigma-70, region 4
VSGAKPTRPATKAGRELPAESGVGSVGSAGRDRPARVIDVPGTEPAGMLELLTGPEWEVLVLRVLVGLSVEQTARVLGSTPLLVRVAQHRALNRLRDLIRRQAVQHTPRPVPPPPPPSPSLLSPAASTPTR